MHDNPNIKYRPSLIEENPALLIWLLLLVAYLLVVVIAKYAWFVRDEQIIEATLWLLLIAMGMFIAVHQFLRAGKIRNKHGLTSCRPFRRAGSGNWWRRRGTKRPRSFLDMTSMANPGNGMTKPGSCRH